MSKEKKLALSGAEGIIPQLRFPEFEEEWKLTKLENLVKLLSGYAFKDLTYIKGGRKLLIPKNFTNSGYASFNNENTKYTSENPNSKYNCKNGDLLILLTDLTPSCELLGKPLFLLEKDGEVLLNQRISKVITSDKMYSRFLLYFFLTDAFHKRIKNTATGSTVKHSSNKIILNSTISFPTKKEQEKIAACLSSLDKVITAETEKLDLLQDHKKGLLQQLFPAEGETQPKFRFPEFKDDGDWKETTLEEVADYENGKAHEQEISDTGKYKVINSKFISTDGEVVKFTDSANLMANTGDILMVLSDIPNGRAIAKCFYVDEDDTYTVNQRICKITPTDIDNRFLFYIQNRNKYFLAFDDGVKQTNLRKETVLSFPFLKPKDPKEQKKIATCLTLADDLIKKQADKIVSLQEHKKGLLQQLFPQEKPVKTQNFASQNNTNG